MTRGAVIVDRRRPTPWLRWLEPAVKCDRAPTRFGTVRAVDLRYLERWAATRREPALRQMGVDEIYRGKNDKFLTVVSNLETGEPLWFGKERKKETLDEFFRTQLRSGQRGRIGACCVLTRYADDQINLSWIRLNMRLRLWSGNRSG